MTQQNNSNSGGNSSSNPGGGNRRPQNSNPNRRRPSHHQNRDNRGPRPQGQQGQQGQQQNNAPQSAAGARPAQPQREGQNRPQGQNQNRRRFNNQNRNRPQGQGRPQQQHAQSSGGFNIDRIYEKYLNLLDQHLIARRKYHDLFYRAEPAQKIKLEKNFYNTLNDIREFESRLAPDVKDLFEKRNNGYQYDRTYTSNHEIPVEGVAVANDMVAEDPHLLQSQIQANYKDDTEESVGSIEDYLKYKN